MSPIFNYTNWIQVYSVDESFGNQRPKMYVMNEIRKKNSKMNWKLNFPEFESRMCIFIFVCIKEHETLFNLVKWYKTKHETRNRETNCLHYFVKENCKSLELTLFGVYAACSKSWQIFLQLLLLLVFTNHVVVFFSIFYYEMWYRILCGKPTNNFGNFLDKFLRI